MWIKAHKTRATVYNGDPNQSPASAISTACMWIEVQEGDVPEINGPGDSILFTLTTPLSGADLVAENVIRLKTAGTFSHALTVEEIAVIEKDNRNISRRKTPAEIFHAIWAACADPTQQGRIMALLNSYAVFLVALDTFNYTVARSIIDGALGAGQMIQADHDLINGALPEMEV